MKNIFILTNDMNGGGAENVLITILRHLPKEDFRVTLGLVYKRGIHMESIPPWVEVRFLFDEYAKNTTKAIQEDDGALYKQIAPQDSDIEVAFLEGGATKILSKSDNSNASKIAWVHIDLLHFHYTKYLYHDIQHEYECYKKFDKVVCVSKEVENALCNLFGGIRDLPVCVIHNPIDHLEIERLSKEFDVKKRGTTICASGRLVEQKGFSRLIDAVHRLNGDGFRFDTWILGEGEDHDALQNQIIKSNLEDTVTLLGFHRNPYPYMAKADIFVCSSLAEGMSIVIGEALILNKSIVATDCCGLREALQDGKYGRIVKNDTQGLYQGLYDAITEVSFSGGCLQQDVCRHHPYNLQICMQKVTALFTG